MLPRWSLSFEISTSDLFVPHFRKRETFKTSSREKKDGVSSDGWSRSFLGVLEVFATFGNASGRAKLAIRGHRKEIPVGRELLF